MAVPIDIMRAMAACFVPRRPSLEHRHHQNGEASCFASASSSISSSFLSQTSPVVVSGTQKPRVCKPSNAAMKATEHGTTTAIQTQSAHKSGSLLRLRGPSSARQLPRFAITTACILLTILISPVIFLTVDTVCVGDCSGYGEQQMQMLQIEKIKQTILDKLRLDRPPRVAADRRVPENVVQQMLSNDVTREDEDEDNDVDILSVGNGEEVSSALAAPPTAIQRRLVENFKSISAKRSAGMKPLSASLLPPLDSSNSIAEFYAKNAEILLVADNSSTDCVSTPTGMCVAFSVANLMQQQLTPESIDRAVMYIPMSQVRPLGQKIRISSPSRHINTIYTIGRNGENTGFMPVDITEHVHYWLRSRQRHWRVHINCDSCGPSRLQLNTMGNMHLRPYMSLFPLASCVLHASVIAESCASAQADLPRHNSITQHVVHQYRNNDVYAVQKHKTRTGDRNKKQRDRRAADCVAGMDTCCRKELLIDFSSIGWDQWILHPKEYQAYYCNGSCNSGIHFPQSEWSMIMQHRMNVASETSTTPPDLPLQVPICCSPTRMSSLSLLYYDEDGNILKARMPNMIVEECGCS